MNNTMIDMGLARYATAEEVSVFDKVEALLKNISDETFDKVVTAISDYAFDYERNRKYYQRIYRLAKKLGIMPSELMLWYFIEELN